MDPGDSTLDGEVDGEVGGEVEVFATGSSSWRTIDRPPSDEELRAALADQLHRTGAAVRDAVQHAREFHARPGHRPGHVAPPSASARRGGSTDIVRPVLVDPVWACEQAISGRLFDEPLDHLDVDHPGHLVSLTWDVEIRTSRHRHHPATLCLLASPSMVVTIIELVARRRIRRDRQRFVREGIAALDELAERLEATRIARVA